MPRDAELGRGLAEYLRGQFSDLVNDIQFTYDPYADLSEITIREPFCRVYLSNLQHVREGRGIWRETTVLHLSLVSAVGSTDDPFWVDRWLDSWDALVDNVKRSDINRQKPSAVTVEARYDLELFFKSKRLMTHATLNYQNI